MPARSHDNLSDPRFDLIVIGAGINGAGIARDAAMRGLKVLLLDKGDIGGGTSSWSTRLIHGGLRYLEHGEFGLVRESLREREILFRIAPHLVKAFADADSALQGCAARAMDHSRGDARLRRAVFRQITSTSSHAYERRSARAGAGAGLRRIAGRRAVLRRAG